MWENEETNTQIEWWWWWKEVNCMLKLTRSNAVTTCCQREHQSSKQLTVKCLSGEAGCVKLYWISSFSGTNKEKNIDINCSIDKSYYSGGTDVNISVKIILHRFERLNVFLGRSSSPLGQDVLNCIDSANFQGPIKKKTLISIAVLTNRTIRGGGLMLVFQWKLYCIDLRG